MMFVVKTIQQLEAAIGKNAEELIIVGSQAPVILEAISSPPVDEELKHLYPIFSRVNKNFEILELVDNSQMVEGILRQKPVLSELT